MREAPLFEVTADVRTMAEKSLEQVKYSMEVYLRFIQRSISPNGIGDPALSEKVFDYANWNVTSAFEFAKGLMRVKDANELVSMQSAFVQAQMRAIAEQSSGLIETARMALIASDSEESAAKANAAAEPS